MSDTIKFPLPAISGVVAVIIVILGCGWIHRPRQQGGSPGIKNDLEVGMPSSTAADNGNNVNQTNRRGIYDDGAAGHRAMPLSHQCHHSDGTTKMVHDYAAAGVHHGNIIHVGDGKAGQTNRKRVDVGAAGNRRTPSSRQDHVDSSSTNHDNQGLDMSTAIRFAINNAAYSGGTVNHSNVHSSGGGGGGCDSGGGGGDSGGGGGGGGCGGC